MTDKPSDKELQEWFHSSQNGLAHAHGVEFTSEVAEYIALQQCRVQMLISEILELRDLVLKKTIQLNTARDILLNNSKGSYRGVNSGSISAEAANYLQEALKESE